MIDWNNTRYADPLELSRGQGDPLDLASTNEQLYNAVFPGVNNVVRYIGVYSAFCWMSRQVDEHVKESEGQTTSTAEELQLLALEKIELAMLWASGSQAELSGKTRPFPHEGRQQLTMDQWDMGARLMSAPQYLPSLTNGLKFMDSAWHCTDRGRLLAQAFEEKLGAPQAHRWLRDVTCLEATVPQIERVRPVLSVLETPTPAERSAFIASFFPENPMMTGEIVDPRDRQRWCGLHLTLHAIEQLARGAGPVDEQAVREAMTSGVTPSALVVIRPGLETCQALWSVLQVRLLQRMAMETLLAFVIGWVQVHDRSGLRAAHCAGDIGMVAARSFAKVGLVTVADVRAVLARSQGDHPTLLLASITSGGDARDVFFYLRELQKLKVASWHEGQGDWLRLAVMGLVLCAVETENLLQQPWHAKALGSIASEKMALTRLLASLDRSDERLLSDWIQELVLGDVFSRYGEVASQRAVLPNGRLRFDFSEGEFGLELGPPRNRPFRATWQTDKLHTILILLEQCGLVRSTMNEWRLTAQGSRRVAAYESIERRQKRAER